MNFSYNGVDPSKTIKRLYKGDGKLIVEHLDGSLEEFFYSISNEETLENIMIAQALKRDKNMNLSKIKLKNSLDIILSSVCLSVVALSAQKKREDLLPVSIGALLFSFHNIKDNIEKIRELKKYKLFFKLFEDLGFINKSGILKCVEFDSICQKPFDITTLDDYTYGDVKAINKELIKKKNLTKI